MKTNISKKQATEYLNRRYAYADSPDRYNDIDTEAKESLTDWIRKNLLPRKTKNEYHTCYGMKHIFEHYTGIYVYSGAFKGAMWECGYEPVNYRCQNWNYCISEKSPAFNRRR